MNTDILTGSSITNREINTDALKIYGNSLEFKDTVIQLSNVSLIANNPLTTPKFPIGSIVAIVFGIVCLFLKASAFVILGLFLLCGGGYVIYAWNKQVEREKQLKKLIIATNSGQTFSILFKKGAFLDEVINTLKEIIAHPGHHGDITINIKDNTIASGGCVIDSVNEFNSAGGQHDD